MVHMKPFKHSTLVKRNTSHPIHSLCITKFSTQYLRHQFHHTLEEWMGHQVLTFLYIVFHVCLTIRMYCMQWSIQEFLLTWNVTIFYDVITYKLQNYATCIRSRLQLTQYDLVICSNLPWQHKSLRNHLGMKKTKQKQKQKQEKTWG